MSRARLYLPFIIIAAACSDAVPTELAPATLDPSFSIQGEVAGDYPTDRTVVFSEEVGPVVTGCSRVVTHDTGCTVKVGETHLVGWLIPEAAYAVMGIRSPAQIAFVIGGTDTIPGPPAPGPARHAIRLAGGAAALDAMFTAAGFVGPTDTIPGPPAPFVFYNGNDALMLFAVQDLMNKGVLRQTSTEVSTQLAVIWTTGSGQSTQSWSAVGMLPPTDTIPGPPGPAPTATKRGK